MSDFKMSGKQVDMARHALGLPRIGGVSYRNRYYTGTGSVEHAAWAALVNAGYAKVEPAGDNYQCFHLTHTGAAQALLENESLDPEDFPKGMVA